ncbi:MAG: VWA domain-containing protein [Anaerolineae bacterium]|nr:VWA domain-containing protein [Anaerolineae bacterium]
MDTKKRSQLITFLTLGLLLLFTVTASSQEGVNLAFNEFDYNAFPELKTTVTVINNSGIPYRQLQPGDFQAAEDGKRVEIKTVTEKVNPDVKISVVLAIDGSGSMGAGNFKPWRQAKESAITFLRALGPADEAALVVFGDAVNTNEPILENIDPVREANFTADKQSLIAKVENLPDPVPGETTTPLYDGAYKSVRLAAEKKGGSGKRAVILFTDGKEGREDGTPVSKLSQEAAISEAQNKHIPVFSIRLGALPDTEYLRRLAVLTGGSYFEAAEAAALAGVYQEISDQLKTQYDLTFASNLRCDNKDHGLEIKVKTIDGETVNTETFTALCPVKPGIQLFYEKPSEVVGGKPTMEPLPDNFEVPQSDEYKLFNIVPVISARYPIERVEYFIDDAAEPFIVTNAPFSYLWDTATVTPGGHRIRVVAYDDQSPSNQGEKAVTMRAGWLVTDESLLPVWAWVVIIILLIILVVATALILRARRTEPEVVAVGVDYADAPTQQPPAPIGPGPFDFPPAGPTAPPSASGVPLIVTGEAPGVAPPGRPGVGMPIPPTQAIGEATGAVAFLVMEQGNRPGQQYPLGEQNTIGRDGGQCDLVIDDGSVSRRHARIKQQSRGVFYIYDLAATNPIRVNGQETSGMRLEDGDKIELGRVRLVFKQVK